MGFREPLEKELKVIRKALKFFGFKFESVSRLDFELLIHQEDSVKEVYALTPELAEFLKNTGVKVVSAGIKVGEVGKRFRLTLEGAFFLVKAKKKRIYVNRKGEMLFLYGRDIFASSVMKALPDIRENDIVFVCNTKGDILGIGKSRYDAERIRSVEEDKVVIENLVDRGEYLRKERLYRAF
jgi:60S ribosome subunit biogenesis protein NIP7